MWQGHGRSALLASNEGLRDAGPIQPQPLEASRVPGRREPLPRCPSITLVPAAAAPAVFQKRVWPRPLGPSLRGTRRAAGYSTAPSLWSSVRKDLCRGRRMACRASFAWQRPGQISIDFDPFVPEVPSLLGPAKSRVPDGRRRRLVPEPPRASRCQLGDRLARTENQSDRSSPRSCDRSARKGAYKSRARACRAAQR